MVSSRVEWKASISEMGKRSMKPTVSVMRNFRFENSIMRVVVDKVVNNALSTSTVSSVNALKSELFPEFVYPASETVRKPSSVLLSR